MSRESIFDGAGTNREEHLEEEIRVQPKRRASASNKKFIPIEEIPSTELDPLERVIATEDNNLEKIGVPNELAGEKSANKDWLSVTPGVEATGGQPREAKPVIGGKPEREILEEVRDKGHRSPRHQGKKPHYKDKLGGGTIRPTRPGI